MKKCVVVINPKSGRGLNQNLARKIETILDNYNYDPKILFTKYRNHASEIVLGLDNDIDLLISVGGDGTFSEVVNGNLKREMKILLAHLPVGTTNDIGHMYGLGNNLLLNLKKILTGEIQTIDIGLINNHAFTYVASYGKFMDIPYQTPQELKKKLGYLAYIVEIFKQAFTHIPRHNITFLIDGVKHQGKYTFIIISNATRIAGFNNFYKDIKLDDNKFEVMLCSLTKKIDILKAIYTLKTSDISYVSGIEIYKASELKIIFEDRERPWCVDGEKLDDNANYCHVKLTQELKMLVPSKNVKKLFATNLQ